MNRPYRDMSVEDDRFNMWKHIAVLTIYTVILLPGARLKAQEVKVKIDYEMRQFERNAYKTGIAETIGLKIGNEEYMITHDGDDYHNWDIQESNMVGGMSGHFSFIKDESTGIGWKLETKTNGAVEVNLSSDITDMNDPREFRITSDPGKGIYMVYNEEPDCNSEFTTVETAESPTLLTGVARTIATATNKKPCGKGKWSINVTDEIPREELIAFVFASIQSINVRYWDEL